MIKQDYLSPRWSGEVCDCSMPLTFDTYSGCSFNCLFCFAFFQKSHTIYKDELNPITRENHSINPENVKTIFKQCLNDNPKTKEAKQFYPYIKNKITMQWGGLSDPFDYNEEKYGISLEMLKFFDEIDYPLSISTHGSFFTKKKEYMDLIKKHSHNWHFKISIITTDKKKAEQIEQLVPTPQQRFNAMNKLTKKGIHVTLRLRPYIIGISEDFKQTITTAKKNGADSVTTEFFCLDLRANNDLKNKYKQISKICGFDIYNFYKEQSHTAGYLRLNYNIKRKIINEMKEITHKNNMRFYVSDAHHKEKSDETCCCGCPSDFKIYKGQYAEALQIAKNNPEHIVQWKDIEKQAEEIFGNVNFMEAIGFNTNSSRMRGYFGNQSFKQYLQTIWNTPKTSKSPYNYFEGILYPIGLDKENNIIYKYNKNKADK